MPFLSSIGGGSAGGYRAASAAGVAYISATGGSITTDGNYKIHDFTSSGTFTITAAPDGATIEAMIIGGGGSGGWGGGGGGGYYYNSAIAVSAGSYTVVIGRGGGRFAPYVGEPGISGEDTTFAGKTALGGGGGAPSKNAAGLDGGSGGGGGGNGALGGTGLQPTSATGGRGSNGTTSEYVDGFTGGGGGAASDVASVPQGNGGRWPDINLPGGVENYAQGGVGNGFDGTGFGGDGDDGKGRGGGAGHGAYSPGRGGSGIVRIKYQFQA